ncbi:MAG: DUF72 domain-containing protein [Candidatus Krumholzibacteriia bacterium]
MGGELEYLFGNLLVLGDRLGPVLFQLPPRCRPVLEFREPSWQHDEVYETLRANGVALCIVDDDSKDEVPLVPTARFGYLRMRRDEYGTDDLRAWVERIRGKTSSSSSSTRAAPRSRRSISSNC